MSNSKSNSVRRSLTPSDNLLDHHPNNHLLHHHSNQQQRQTIPLSNHQDNHHHHHHQEVDLESIFKRALTKHNPSPLPSSSSSNKRPNSINQSEIFPNTYPSSNSSNPSSNSNILNNNNNQIKSNSSNNLNHPYRPYLFSNSSQNYHRQAVKITNHHSNLSNQFSFSSTNHQSSSSSNSHYNILNQNEPLDRPSSRASTPFKTNHHQIQSNHNNNNLSSNSNLNLNLGAEKYPRQWSWTGVDFLVQNLNSLRNQIENSHPQSDNEFDSFGNWSIQNLDHLKEISNASSGEVASFRFSNERWKVEIVKTHHHHRRPSAPTTPTKSVNPSTIYDSIDQSKSLSSSPSPSSQQNFLSIYLTCHESENHWPTPRSISTSIMISVKEPKLLFHSNSITTNLASTSEGWIWRVCCPERCFEREDEVWECHSFPSLSSLLENPRVAMFDSFVLSVQIGTPPTISLPQIPFVSYVPHSILQGLESLLDDKNTADLQVLVNEFEEKDLIVQSRQRVLYAHSNILKHRSDYFKMMLADENSGGGWAESGGSIDESAKSNHHRKLGLIKIEDFDFVSVYWLLHWLYSNRIFFTEHEDVRAQCHLGSALSLYGSGNIFDLNLSVEENPWEWKSHGGHSGPNASNDDIEVNNKSVHLDKVIDDSDRVCESEAHESSLNSPKSKITFLSQSTTTLSKPCQPQSSPTLSHKRTSINQVSPVVSPGKGKQIDSNTTFSNHKNKSRQNSLTHPTQSINATTSSSTSQENSNLSPLADLPNNLQSHDDFKASNTWVLGDPHSHPIEIKAKASALSIYRISHRYELKDLKDLALNHLIANLNPSNAFSMLLSSYVFPELHSKIKAYCLTNYYDIIKEPEFKKCYNEVGEGLWENGGEVLLSFTMNLIPASFNWT
ncbi:hypothetical protein O181_023462 [Austropuccinia psidii MF-1]|uniref:BTB domain-containing protein n=1 Tax=Austropuccinia psidii MF-1 TaxID=1389203 RepID=A0A9Q3GY20_9BASI|nr:hypothetical protein [Austropuccinia psidii MF-1]